ncbi:endopeptidase La [Gracilinema caldarium]|uniref:Lon protease n=1 Tax=Gracilinema caldarium (strain ATCC 51460 / DSM 7334 / H1) TaxID=744872 RepID=F8F457_GRAC1|nr:endopeptidase La [Gracilinema caldarium]AEJ20076.1 anti-sigma H sporulation factor, LonB [Gracilinema caldarium DSM 7334]
MSEQGIVPIEQILPNKLYLVALMGRPIFPGIFTPIMIGNPADVKVVDEAMVGDGLIGLVMLQNETESPTIDDLYKVGTVAKIVKKINLPDGGVNIFISTMKRFRIKKALNEANPIVAAVEYLEDEEDDTSEVKALTRALISEMKQVSENNPLFSEEMRLNMINIDHPGKIADFIASILNIDKIEQQRILEILNVRKRMEQVLVFIKKEQELLKIQKKIQNEINEKIEKSQREYFLREELKAIKKELGMTTDAKSSEYQKFRDKLYQLHLEPDILEVIDQELEKFSLMDPNSSEFIVTRNYLDTVLNLPWDAVSGKPLDMEYARKVLEEDHYGLKDVKDRIMEFLAVRKLRQDTKGTILCLVGPPGVGKTSVGRSIARALNKQFFRFSVGGMRDEAEIKGHRRTYVGAMPGKIIQGLKLVKTKDPVFMIDEIDKMGSSYQGDPSSALLEVLDPEQNYAFRDHYLDLPFDVSQVFFIVTANTLDTIPGPLLDRMEVIQIPGYIDLEKLEIAKQYLIPKSLEKNGLQPNQVRYTRDALLYIANGYAREAGVRNFEKNLDKIHRKLAKHILDTIPDYMDRLHDQRLKHMSKVLKVDEEELRHKEEHPVKLFPTERQVGDMTVNIQYPTFEDKNNPEKPKKRSIYKLKEEEKFVIDKSSVEKYLGKPVFADEDIKRADRPGMAIGLAWTSMGGDTLIIEAVATPGKEGLTLTGKMGEVMKESATIAYTYTRKLVSEKYGIGQEWFEKNHIHLHIPEGATPKDGPSAGITMATALISLVTNRTIMDRIVMTGELSLTGQVLPIGGLKEKTIAAQRNKAKHIIIPKKNLRDLDEIPEHVKKGLEFHPVERYEEVLALVLPDK